jgi:ADP-ribose pyrophosphatase YjhB (NUDIX family)|tara:strand:- start:6116 stop:6664 length:549 start_codon:yes stop_codon:yes gene_type:complete
MNFCSQCGKTVSQQIPDGDTHLRFVCTGCGAIHYQNPRIVTGCLAYFEEKILLCKRAIEPRSGLWTLPAGYLENGETTTEGALRETLEEANARADIINIYTLFSLPHISQVYMFFLAELKDLNFSPGLESSDVKLFAEEEIPWQQLAFPTVHDTLEFYLEDRKTGNFPVRVREILYKPRKDP